jgi:hypothetical protein
MTRIPFVIHMSLVLFGGSKSHLFRSRSVDTAWAKDILHLEGAALHLLEDGLGTTEMTALLVEYSLDPMDSFDRKSATSIYQDSSIPELKVVSKTGEELSTLPKNDSRFINTSNCSIERTRELFRSGHSFVLTHVQHIRTIPPPIHALNAEILSWRLPFTNINAYFSGRGGRALPAHQDNTDVMVVQVGGVKQWRLCVPIPPLWPQRQNLSEFSDGDLGMAHFRYVSCSNVRRPLMRFISPGNTTAPPAITAFV